MANIRTAYTPAASASRRHVNGARNGVARAIAWAAKNGREASQLGRSRSSVVFMRPDVRAGRHGRVTTRSRRPTGGCRGGGQGPPFSEGWSAGALSGAGDLMVVTHEEG